VLGDERGNLGVGRGAFALVRVAELLRYLVGQYRGGPVRYPTVFAARRVICRLQDYDAASAFNVEATTAELADAATDSAVYGLPEYVVAASIRVGAGRLVRAARVGQRGLQPRWEQLGLVNVDDDEARAPEVDSYTVVGARPVCGNNFRVTGRLVMPAGADNRTGMFGAPLDGQNVQTGVGVS
jgi:hypothetical protein